VHEPIARTVAEAKAIANSSFQSATGTVRWAIKNPSYNANSFIRSVAGAVPRTITRVLTHCNIRPIAETCKCQSKNPRRSIASTRGRNCRWSCPMSRRSFLLPIHRTNRAKNRYKSRRSFQPDPSQEPWQHEHKFVQPTCRMYRCRSRRKKRRKIFTSDPFHEPS